MAKVLSILFVVAMGLSAGCGEDEESKTLANSAPLTAIDKLEAIRTEMCACKDAACAKEVGEDMKSRLEGMSEPSGEDKEKAEKIVNEMMKCAMTAAMGSAAKPSGAIATRGSTPK